MAVFMDTGNGDIYAGENEEACLEAMRADAGDEWFAKYCKPFEISADTIMRDDKEREITLEDAYRKPADGKGYCICSENC